MEKEELRIIERRRKERIYCIILAAGNSERIGKCKQELLLNNVPLLLWNMKPFLCFDVTFVIVSGKYFANINEIFKKNINEKYDNYSYYNYLYSKTYNIENKNPQNGMFSSLKTGLEFIFNNLEKDTKKDFQIPPIFFTLSDMPFVQNQTIESLYDSLLLSKVDFCVPVFNLQNFEKNEHINKHNNYNKLAQYIYNKFYNKYSNKHLDQYSSAKKNFSNSKDKKNYLHPKNEKEYLNIENVSAIRKKGHPVILSSKFACKFLQLDNISILRDVLKTGSFFELETCDIGTIFDIDTMFDYNLAADFLNDGFFI